MTPKKIHNFKDSLKRGEEAEAILDKFFNKKFKIESAELTLQKYGVDRIFTHKRNGNRCTVEYKADFREEDTGNVFIEIWSNKEKNLKGWAYTSVAQWLYFYLPSKKEVVVMDVVNLKQQLGKLEKENKTASCVNSTPKGGFYSSEGILLPTQKLKLMAYEVVNIA